MTDHFQPDELTRRNTMFRRLVVGSILSIAFPAISSADDVRRIICMKEDGSSGFHWSINYSRNTVKPTLVDKALNIGAGDYFNLGWKPAQFSQSHIIMEHRARLVIMRQTLNRHTGMLRVEWFHSNGRHEALVTQPCFQHEEAPSGQRPKF
jgi:hypothetical protein